MPNVQVYIKRVACGPSLIIKIWHTAEHGERFIHVI